MLPVTGTFSYEESLGYFHHQLSTPESDRNFAILHYSILNTYTSET